MLVLLFMLFLHLSWPAAGKASSSSLALPGCPDKCGSVTIPYPFGMRDGCYRKDDESNQTFLITCKHNSIPPQPFLGRSKLKVLEASSDKVIIESFSSSLCYNESGVFSNQKADESASFCSNESGEISNQKEDESAGVEIQPKEQYVFSDVKNRFVVLGCNVQAMITDKYSNFRRKCRTYCNIQGRDDAEKSVLQYLNGPCDVNNGCCQTSIPKGLKQYYIHFNTCQTSIPKGLKQYHMPFKGLKRSPVPFNTTVTTQRRSSSCFYAFLVNKDYFDTSLIDLSDTDLASEGFAVSIVLDWAVGNKTCQEAHKNKTNFACGDNSNCSDSTNGPGYRCTCLPGYDGNPYLPQGCQDIDECQNSTLNICVPGACNNFPGGHNCSCPKGAYGDGKIVGKGCNKRGKSFIKIIVGVGSGLIFLLVIGFWLYFGLKKRKLVILKEKFFKQILSLILQQHIHLHQDAAETHKIFTAKELKKATDNYNENRIVGKGGHGTVYKGTLSENTVVAIKKAKIVDSNQIEQFSNEVKILSQINHRNVVKLVGSCLETEVPLLVYEFVSNGTLYHHIHGDHSHVSPLSWETRLRILYETASALSYLHTSASIPIVHGDIKSANILLDHKYTVKISDFGASKLISMEKDHMTTLVRGTVGYLDPEYFHTNQLRPKSDVYSFGIVLVELLTGRVPFSFGRPEKERSLGRCLILSMEENRLYDILDSQVVVEGVEEQLLAVAELAKRCLAEKGDERPTMKEVEIELEGLTRLKKHPSDQNCAEECTVSYGSMNSNEISEMDMVE